MPAAQSGHYLAAQSKLIQSQRASVRQQEFVRRQIDDANAAEEHLLWSKLESTTTVPPNVRVLRLMVPCGHAPIGTQPVDRQQAHFAHLRAIIAEAFESPGLAPLPAEHSDSTEAPDSMACQLCSMCGGGCCASGGDAAYLTVETIRRVMWTRPEADEQELLEMYISQLPQTSVDGSCIYHTATGCALPRSLRSNSCNEFSCSSLDQLLTTLAHPEGLQTAAMVVQRRQSLWGQHLEPGLNNEIIAAALITDAGTSQLALLPDMTNPETTIV